MQVNIERMEYKLMEESSVGPIVSLYLDLGRTGCKNAANGDSRVHNGLATVTLQHTPL